MVLLQVSQAHELTLVNYLVAAISILGGVVAILFGYLIKGQNKIVSITKDFTSVAEGMKNAVEKLTQSLDRNTVTTQHLHESILKSMSRRDKRDE